MTDLEGVQKHLATMEKMNNALQAAIAEYGLTGNKVTRMINAVKKNWSWFLIRFMLKFIVNSFKHSLNS